MAKWIEILLFNAKNRIIMYKYILTVLNIIIRHTNMSKLQRIL